jgi:hypothetical protein
LNTKANTWERREGESEKAHAAFCRYLELPKKGGERTKNGPRRRVEDLARELGVKSASVRLWFGPHEWKERAAAYDEFMAFKPTEIAAIQERDDFVKEIREAGAKFREIAAKAIEKFLNPEDGSVEMAADEAVKVYKLGMELEKEAAKLKAPQVAKKGEQLNEEISKLIGTITTRLGKDAGGGARGALTATERTVRFDLDAGDDSGPGVRTVSTEPRSIRQIGLEAELVGGPDTHGSRDSREPESNG